MKSSLIALSALLYCNTAVMIYMGIIRFTKYYNSTDYPDLNKYAYVGGDAYNMIINSTIQNSFFILAASSFIVASMFICTVALMKRNNN